MRYLSINKALPDATPYFVKKGSFLNRSILP